MGCNHIDAFALKSPVDLTINNCQHPQIQKAKGCAPSTMNARTAKTVNRKLVVWRGLIRNDAISRAAHSTNKGNFEAAINFLTQTTHLHIEDFRFWLEAVFPDAFQKHGTGDGLTSVPH